MLSSARSERNSISSLYGTEGREYSESPSHSRHSDIGLGINGDDVSSCPPSTPLFLLLTLHNVSLLSQLDDELRESVHPLDDPLGHLQNAMEQLRQDEFDQFDKIAVLDMLERVNVTLQEIRFDRGQPARNSLALNSRLATQRAMASLSARYGSDDDEDVRQWITNDFLDTNQVVDAETPKKLGGPRGSLMMG